MKRTGLLIFMLLATSSLFAQQKEMKDEAGSRVYIIETEEKFIEDFNWLMNTPINEEEEKRKQVMAGISSYIENHPDLEIVLDPKVVNFAEDNPDLLLIFMGGWAKHSLENKDYNNKVEGNLAGIDNVIAFYENNQQYLDDDKKVEKYQKLKEKGKLEKRIGRKVN